jgi:hypothetical protein
MKKTIILAALVASLLVVTGIAFAGPTPSCCYDVCYKVTGTNLTNPGEDFTADWAFCFDGYPFGWVCDRSGPTFLFFFAAYPENLLYHVTSFDSGTVGAYMQIHGIEGDVFNGLYFNSGNRMLIHGIMEQQCLPPII